MQRVTEHEGDLVAKCYYAKRKLVWEILDNGLKSKIELQWSDIIAIRAVIEENQPGILEIEVMLLSSFQLVTKIILLSRLHIVMQAAYCYGNIFVKVVILLQLGQPPTFHRESNPQPRKHTMWNPATDFTGGAALIHR